MNKPISKIEESLLLVERFKALFLELNGSNCYDGLIERVYRRDMCFEDSFHKIDGREAFKAYCASVYENLITCKFEFTDQWVTEKDAMLAWKMEYAHPKLNKSHPISVHGSSLIRFDNKVFFHRDYFDGGAMLYEHVPVVGKVIKTLKTRLNR